VAGKACLASLAGGVGSEPPGVATSPALSVWGCPAMPGELRHRCMTLEALPVFHANGHMCGEVQNALNLMTVGDG